MSKSSMMRACRMIDKLSERYDPEFNLNPNGPPMTYVERQLLEIANMLAAECVTLGTKVEILERKLKDLEEVVENNYWRG